MALELDFQVETARQLRALRGFERSLQDKAIFGALQKTAQKMQTTAVAEIAAFLGLRKKVIARRLSFDASTQHGAVARRGYRSRLTVDVKTRGRPFNVIRWIQSRSLPVVHNAWGRAVTLERHVFIGNRGRTVFKRQTHDRLNIKGVWGPGATHAAQDPKVEQAVLDRADKEYPKDLTSQIDRFLVAYGYRGVVR